MFDSVETVLIVLLVLLGIQLTVLFFLRKTIVKMGSLMKDFRRIQKIASGQGSGKFLSEKKFKICQNCSFRQTFIKNDDENFNYFYRCKLHDIEVGLEHSCVDFHTESFPSNKS